MRYLIMCDVKRFIRLQEVNKIILQPHICLEAAVKKIDQDWLELKTKETLNNLPGTETPAAE